MTICQKRTNIKHPLDQKLLNRNTEMPGSLLAAGPPESVVQASDPVLQAHRTRPQDTEVPPQVQAGEE